VDTGLCGKVALVGASSAGLGFAVAESLIAEGAYVVICGRDAPRLAMARDRLKQRGGRVAAAVADLSTDQGIDAVVNLVLEEFGSIEVLVTNTGGPPPGLFESHLWSAWKDAIALLLKSAVELTRRVLPSMREKRWGRIIGITSMAVKHPVNSLILSNSLRAAVTGCFRTLAFSPNTRTCR
jgi:3-oxoacyl-[acyl-carrier protein] reductase